jgi:hypothetical protein
VPPLENRAILLMLSVILLGLSCDPALANKFQTIGSGVTGSMKIKIEYLRISAFVVSGLFFIFSLLAATTKKRNAHELNYAVWKPSSIIFLVLSLIALVIALLL